MAECQELELEIPENNDDGVVEAMKFLNRQLRTDLMKNYLKVAGDFLYIATNATAKDAEQQIKVQSCLFDAVKLCDAWNLMLTSFKVGASDILEKLHIAYLKLLDGFPDFALADVESVTKHVSSMKAACKKAEGSFKTVTRELEDTIGFLKDEEKKNRTIRDNCLRDYGKKEDALKKRIIEQMQRGDLTVFAEDASLKILELELEGPVDNFHSVSKKIENCVLAKAALLLALPKLKDALEFLVKIEELVDKWYNECKEVVEKNMKANVKQAGKLSEAKQKEYWKPLVFVKTAYDFLCRWKALQQICLSTSTHMRRVRGDIDWYYTENLYPAEAVEKAWDMREKNEELKKKVEPRKMDMVITEENQIQSLRSFQMLLKQGRIQSQDNLYRCAGYKQFETICCFLWVLEKLNEPEIKNIKRDGSEVCGTLLEVTGEVQDQSVQELAGGYVTFKRRLRGIPIVKKEVKTKKIGTKGSKQELTSIAKLVESIQKLTSNGSNLTSTMSKIEGYVERGEKQLPKDIKDEEEATATDKGHARFSAIKTGINSVFPEYFSPTKKKSDSVAESIKMHKLLIALIESVVEKLQLKENFPLTIINDVYSKVSKRLTEFSSHMQEQLDKVEEKNGEAPVPRNQEWQNGVFCILGGFIELFSASTVQIDNVQSMLINGRINEQHTTGISWKMLKEMVGTERFLYKRVGEINEEVDNKVARLRTIEKQNHERMILEQKEIAELEKKQKDREELARKTKEREELESRKKKKQELERKKKEREELAKKWKEREELAWNRKDLEERERKKEREELEKRWKREDLGRKGEEEEKRKKEWEQLEKKWKEKEELERNRKEMEERERKKEREELERKWERKDLERKGRGGQEQARRQKELEELEKTWWKENEELERKTKELEELEKKKEREKLESKWDREDQERKGREGHEQARRQKEWDWKELEKTWKEREELERKPKEVEELEKKKERDELERKWKREELEKKGREGEEQERRQKEWEELQKTWKEREELERKRKEREQEKRQTEWEELERKRKEREELERKRKESEQLERKKEQEEMERRWEREEMERKGREGEEQERKQKESEELQRKQEEREELERKRKERAQLERKQKESAEFEKKQKEWEELEMMQKEREELERALTREDVCKKMGNDEGVKDAKYGQGNDIVPELLQRKPAPY